VALTGLPLLVLAIAAALAAFGLTIRYWPRGGRWRILTRTTGVLVCEALVLFTAGLVVNRALDNLFPSWTTLLHQDSAPPPAALAAPRSRLDAWLHTRAAQGAREGLVVDWTPPAARSWSLSAIPVLAVPPDYFTATAARFPVVVVVTPDGVPPPIDPPAIVVVLRTDRLDPTFLTRTLPAALGADLRVAPHGWGVVGVGADAAAGLDALDRDSARYWSAVAAADAADRLPDAVFAPRDLAGGQAALTIAGGSGGALPATGRVQVVGPVPERLPAALRWVYAHLPAPLAAPLPTGPATPPLPVPAASR